uniref:Uncharacterized protein n=1 Tax=Arion vulgaris TaxID=1028688 RepID=A0A0B6ZPP9_9EUPU
MSWGCHRDGNACLCMTTGQVPMLTKRKRITCERLDIPYGSHRQLSLPWKLEWNPQEKRKKRNVNRKREKTSSPKHTKRRSLLVELKKAGLSWGTTIKTARDQERWEWEGEEWKGNC